MKRIQVLGVALLMGAAAALVACGGNQTNNNNQTTDSTEQTAPATDAQGQPTGEMAESACSVSLCRYTAKGAMGNGRAAWPL